MIYSFLYVFVFSIALILIQKLDLSIPPLFSLLITTIIASLYFNLINKSHLKRIYSDIFGNIKRWFVVMGIVLIMWATTMVGPGKIGASLFNFIYFAWLGFLGFASLSFNHGKKIKINFYFGLALLLLIIINIYLQFQSAFSYEICYGIMMAFIGGTASFFYFKQSQAFAKNASLSATQVLAVRFYLTIIILAIILPKSGMGHYLTFANLINLILLSFCSLIIPLYFSQKALERITSEQHAIINSLCPLVTGILQTIIFHDLRKEQLLVYFVYSLTIGCFYFIKKHNE